MKKKLLQLIIFLTLGFSVIAQDAPDFTVTDSKGGQHTLYADYLNQDKTVVLKIFFTTCPPCNQIAPLMEPLYQEWGSGKHDVEFFELSTQSFDDNQRINNYADQYAITFPSVGSEGGSLEATKPYRDGDFGLFTGTPTFVVIAPDGTVHFDVSGLGNQGTIDALNEAIAATGAVKPSTTSIFNPGSQRNDLLVQPNPFHAETSIEVSTRTGGDLRLELFDILGNRIENYEHEVPHAGEYSISRDFETLRSGTYILRASLNGLPIKSVKVIKRG